jgi:hypothetical protein
MGSGTTCLSSWQLGLLASAPQALREASTRLAFSLEIDAPPAGNGEMKRNTCEGKPFTLASGSAQAALARAVAINTTLIERIARIFVSLYEYRKAA